MTFAAVMLLLTGSTAFFVVVSLRVLEAAAERSRTVSLERIDRSAVTLTAALQDLRDRTVAFQHDPAGRSCST